MRRARLMTPAFSRAPAPRRGPDRARGEERDALPTSWGAVPGPLDGPRAPPAPWGDQRGTDERDSLAAGVCYGVCTARRRWAGSPSPSLPSLSLSLPAGRSLCARARRAVWPPAPGTSRRAWAPCGGAAGTARSAGRAGGRAGRGRFASSNVTPVSRFFSPFGEFAFFFLLLLGCPLEEREKAPPPTRPIAGPLFGARATVLLKDSWPSSRTPRAGRARGPSRARARKAE